MDELDDIIGELNNVIRELESIEESMRNDFKGIYSGRAADVISSKIGKLYTAKARLSNVDRSRKDEE